MSNKQLNMRPGDGFSWEDKYAIDAGALTNATRLNFALSLVEGVLPHANAIYSGASALTIAEFNAFEVGSTIVCSGITVPGIYVKVGATSWDFIPAESVGTHNIKFAAEVTWTGSGATLAATVTGVLATDIVIASILTLGTEGTILQGAIASTDTITFTLDAANTSDDAVISYAVFRAV